VLTGLRHAIVLSLLLWNPPLTAQAPEFRSRVQAALEQLDATDLDADWYFTMDVVEGEEVRVVESDPTRGLYGRRRLVSVDGEPPHAARREKFRHAEEQRIDHLDPDARGYLYMVDMATLQAVEGAEGYARYTFTPRLKDLEKARDQLEGSLQLNASTGQIDRLSIRNTEPLKPAFSVTVDTYRLVLTFEEEQGERLIRTLVSHTVGKAGFLKGFDAKVDIAFRDFRRAAP
jgi:hypothetical protein